MYYYSPLLTGSNSVPLLNTNFVYFLFYNKTKYNQQDTVVVIRKLKLNDF